MHLKWPSGEQFLYLANYIADKLIFSQKKNSKPKSILIVKWDEIGDMATATHVFYLLKRSHPGAHITLLCKPFVKNLVENDPNLDRIITDIKEVKTSFDALVELRGTWTTLLMAITNGTGFRTGRAEIRFKNRGHQLHETLTNIEIVKPLLIEGVTMLRPKFYFSKEDESTVNSFLSENGIGQFAILHVGARKKLRQWNPGRFALAAEYLKQHYGFNIVFIGSGDEKDDIESVMAKINFKTFEFAGDYTLSQLSALCSRAGFFLGNESGPMHIASGFDVPMLALFGPGVKDVFYPVSPRSSVLHHVLHCNPCDQVHCVQPENPCISMIQVDDVLEKIDEILRK